MTAVIDKDKTFKVFMNHTLNAGVGYYRMINFAKYMQKEKNVHVAYSKFNSNSQSVAEWQLAESKDTIEKVISDIDMLMDVSDVSIWQMVHTNFALSLFRAYREKLSGRKPVLMEIDDYVFNVNPDNPGYANYNSNSDLEYFAEMQMRNANGLIVSTEWLKHALSKYNPCIEVIPNSIDFGVWDKLKNETKPGKVRIGWAGGAAHMKDLRILKDVIPVILNKYKNVEFAFFGFAGVSLPEFIKTGSRVKHINEWYGINEYPANLARQGFDIGVAPLRDCLFNRAKSNLRYLEYSALKIPTVASPIEPFNQTTGKMLYALETDEWVSKLSGLIESALGRKAVGVAAYESVKKHYNAELTGKRYIKVLKDIVSGKIKTTNVTYEDEGGEGIYRMKL